MRKLRLWFLGLAALGLAGISGVGQTQTPSPPSSDPDGFRGEWDILSAVPGPWAVNPAAAEDDKIARRLIGSSVTFGEGAVQAPDPLGCSPATYSFRDARPESLFEGGLAQGPDGKMLDTAALTQQLGITTPTVRALAASCSEVEFYQIAPDVLLFGMDNRIYRLERRKP